MTRNTRKHSTTRPLAAPTLTSARVTQEIFVMFYNMADRTAMTSGILDADPADFRQDAQIDLQDGGDRLLCVVAEVKRILTDYGLALCVGVVILSRFPSPNLVELESAE